MSKKSPEQRGKELLSWLQGPDIQNKPKICVFDLESTIKGSDNANYTAGGKLIYDFAFGSFELGKNFDESSLQHYLNIDVLADPRLVGTIKEWSQVKNAMADKSSYYGFFRSMFSDKEQHLSDEQLNIKQYYTQEKITVAQKSFLDKREKNNNTFFSGDNAITVENTIDALEAMVSHFQTKKANSKQPIMQGKYDSRIKIINQQIYGLQKMRQNQTLAFNYLRNNILTSGDYQLTKSDLSLYENYLASSLGEETLMNYKEQRFGQVIQAGKATREELVKNIQEAFGHNKELKTWSYISQKFKNACNEAGFITSFNFAADKNAIEETNKFCGVKIIQFDDDSIKHRCSLNLFGSIMTNKNKDGFYAVYDIFSPLVESLNNGTLPTATNLKLDSFIQVLGIDVNQIKGTRHTAEYDTKILATSLAKFLQTNLQETIDKAKK